MPKSEHEPWDGDTPLKDSELHTGSEQPIDPIDYAEAKGWDPTPENLERAKKIIAREGNSEAADEAVQ